MRCAPEDGCDVVLEGVVDAVALGDAGWEVVDWKSDVVDDAAWAARLPKYERQVGHYAKMLAQLTGKDLRGRIERVLGWLPPI